MNKFIGALALIIGLIATSCTRVSPGHVGVKVNNWGDNKGVDSYPVVTGFQTYNPITTDIFEFPTFAQNHVWDGEDEEITFNSKEGAVVTADVAISFAIRPDRVPFVFTKFRKGLEDITHVFLRSEVRDVMAREASKTDVVKIFGEGKQDFLNHVTEEMRNRLGQDFEFYLISFVDSLRCDKNVMHSINVTIQATQDAISAQNKVVQATAEADQAIASAKGQAESVRLNAVAIAESTRLQAQAEAEKITMIAKAQADGNMLLSKSLTPQLIQSQQIQRWSGAVPTFMAGNNGPMPLLMIQADKQ